MREGEKNLGRRNSQAQTFRAPLTGGTLLHRGETGGERGRAYPARDPSQTWFSCGETDGKMNGLHALGMARGRKLGIAWSLEEREDVYDWKWQSTLRTEDSSTFGPKVEKIGGPTVNPQSSEFGLMQFE
jgi:hypothetical protein